MAEAGPSGARRMSTNTSKATAARVPIAMKQSITACVVDAERTTLLRTVAPRSAARRGIEHARGGGAVGANAGQHIGVADAHVLADQVGGDLAAHPRQGGDQGGADLAAHEARGLQRRAEGQRVLRPQMQHREEHDAGQREALADRLQQLRGQELLRAPQRA